MRFSFAVVFMLLAASSMPGLSLPIEERDYTTSDLEPRAVPRIPGVKLKSVLNFAKPASKSPLLGHPTVGVRPITRPVTKRPNTNVATRPNINPATRPNINSATRPNINPATRPNTNPATRPNTNPATHPNPNPATHPNTSPATHPNANPATHPISNPVTHLNANPATHPNTNTGAKSHAGTTPTGTHTQTDQMHNERVNTNTDPMNEPGPYGVNDRLYAQQAKISAITDFVNSGTNAVVQLASVGQQGALTNAQVKNLETQTQGQEAMNKANAQAAQTSQGGGDGSGDPSAGDGSGDPNAGYQDASQDGYQGGYGDGYQKRDTLEMPSRRAAAEVLRRDLGDFEPYAKHLQTRAGGSSRVGGTLRRVGSSNKIDLYPREYDALGVLSRRDAVELLRRDSDLLEPIAGQLLTRRGLGGLAKIFKGFRGSSFTHGSSSSGSFGGLNKVKDLIDIGGTAVETAKNIAYAKSMAESTAPQPPTQPPTQSPVPPQTGIPGSQRPIIHGRSLDSYTREQNKLEQLFRRAASELLRREPSLVNEHFEPHLQARGGLRSLTRFVGKMFGSSKPGSNHGSTLDKLADVVQIGSTAADTAATLSTLKSNTNAQAQAAQSYTQPNMANAPSRAPGSTYMY